MSNDATPSSFRVSCVRLGRTVSSMSFSRNAASYFPRPRLRSQTTTSMRAPTISGGTHHLPGKKGVQGGFGVLRASQTARALAAASAALVRVLIIARFFSATPRTVEDERVNLRAKPTDK